MLLLKQDITRKDQIDEKIIKLEFKATGNSKKYEIKIIWDSAVYANKAESYLSGFNYLVV